MKKIDAKNKITLNELGQMAEKMFGSLVKAVADTRQSILIVDAEMHADEEKYLLENGSDQGDLWGINLYPELEGEDFVEFDSMINLRPGQNNRSRSVEDPAIRDKIRTIVDELVLK